MPAGTYEDEINPIPGDVFLDRVLGWLCLVCGLAILGVAVYRLFHLPVGEPTWVQPARVALIGLGLVGIGAIITSKPQAFPFALALHVVRLVGVLALFAYSGPRFAITEIIWNLTVIGYCWLRMRGVSRDR